MDCGTDANIANNEDIGRRLRKQRLTLHLTQEQLSGKVGISPSFLGHIERGTRTASVETLARLCKALDVDMHYIVFGYSVDSAGKSELWDTMMEIYDKIKEYDFSNAKKNPYIGSSKNSTK